MEKIDLIVLDLIEDLKSRNIISFDNDFCESIGLLKQNLNRIKNGKAHFTVLHLKKIGESYNISTDWILGLSAEKYIKKNRQPKSTIKTV